MTLLLLLAWLLLSFFFLPGKVVGNNRSSASLGKSSWCNDPPEAEGKDDDVLLMKNNLCVPRVVTPSYEHAYLTKPEMTAKVVASVTSWWKHRLTWAA